MNDSASQPAARDDRPLDPWAARWARFARPLDLLPSTPVALALSGGADSVFLLHLLARSRPRPKVLAIHVDHRLRGEESDGDAAFCARLCARLGVPFARREVELEGITSDLEARARDLRYRALAEETLAAGFRVLLTGHHEDDAVETLLMRWMRGTDLSGLPGLRRETVLGASFAQGDSATLRLLRPLKPLRREEVRSALRSEGLAWREDSTNATDRFTRGRVRHRVLPEIEATCGAEGVANFFEFARAVESFEDELADRTAHIQWEPVAHEPARRSASMPELGGRVRRDQLQGLSQPLLRRALGRLIGEGTGQRPGKDLLTDLAQDLTERRNGRRELHQGWSVQLRSDGMHLTPPAALLTGGGGTAVASAPKVLPRTAPARAAAPVQAPASAPAEPVSQAQPQSQAPAPATTTIAGEGLLLGLPGSVQLPDGRSIVAELVPADAPLSTTPTVAELDATGLDGLRVRFERPGDRFHPLGAPGHRPLRRFLSDAGIPREERGLVPVVTDGTSIVWLAGLRTAEGRRVAPGTARRVRLTLHGARGA